MLHPGAVDFSANCAIVYCIDLIAHVGAHNGWLCPEFGNQQLINNEVDCLHTKYLSSIVWQFGFRSSVKVCVIALRFRVEVEVYNRHVQCI